MITLLYMEFYVKIVHKYTVFKQKNFNQISYTISRQFNIWDISRK